MSRQSLHNRFVFLTLLSFFFLLSASPSHLFAQTDREKVDVLVEAVKAEMLKAPEQTDNSFLATGEKRDFLMKLSRSLDVRVDRAVGRHADAEFRCEAHIDLLDAMEMTSGESGVLPPEGGSTWTFQAIRCLADNIDQECAFEKYKSLAWPHMEARHTRLIMKHSQKDEIRAWACDKRLARLTRELIAWCETTGAISDMEFARRLNELKTLMATGVNELGGVAIESEAGSTLREAVLFHANATVDHLTPEHELTKERRAQVIEMCKSIASKYER